MITQFAIGSKRLFLHEEQNYVQICGYSLGRFDTICYICEVELTRGIGKLSLQGEQKLYADPWFFFYNLLRLWSKMDKVHTEIITARRAKFVCIGWLDPWNFFYNLLRSRGKIPKNSGNFLKRA